MGIELTVNVNYYKWNDQAVLDFLEIGAISHIDFYFTRWILLPSIWKHTRWFKFTICDFCSILGPFNACIPVQTIGKVTLFDL